MLEGFGFESLRAGEKPPGLGDLIDEEALVVVDGLVLLGQALHEVVEFLLILMGEDGEGGRQSVFSGVGARGGFALGRFGASGRLRVLAVCDDLRLGCHVYSYFQFYRTVLELAVFGGVGMGGKWLVGWEKKYYDFL